MRALKCLRNIEIIRKKHEMAVAKQQLSLIHIWQSFLFSIINYTMLVLIDYVTVLLGRRGSIQEKWFLQALISKTVFIILMLFIRRFSKTRKSCGLITGKEWLQFFCVPVFTVVGFILMFYSENDDMQNVFLFLSVRCV